MAKETGFDALLAELDGLSSDEGMAKAMSTEEEMPEGEEDDENIQAAASDENMEDEENEGDEYMGKAMTVEIDGEQVEAYDGMKIIKSFNSRVEKGESNLAKALATTLQSLKARDTVMAKQGRIIKSLQADVVALQGEGKGRKSVVTMHGDGLDDLNKSEGIPEADFRQMLKSAAASGDLNAMDVGRAESALNDGLAIAPEILSKMAKINH